MGNPLRYFQESSAEITIDEEVSRFSDGGTLSFHGRVDRSVETAEVYLPQDEAQRRIAPRPLSLPHRQAIAFTEETRVYMDLYPLNVDISLEFPAGTTVGGFVSAVLALDDSGTQAV